MDFLKQVLSEGLYQKVVEEIKGNTNIKLANLAEGKYVGVEKYAALQRKLKKCKREEESLKKKIYELERMRVCNLQKQVNQLEQIQHMRDMLHKKEKRGNEQNS